MIGNPIPDGRRFSAGYRRIAALALLLMGAAGCAATPPQPAPRHPADRDFLFFFDWDRVHLTDRARRIAAEFVVFTALTGSTRILISGHADRSGPSAYNQRLSRRRADAAAAELVRLGADPRMITIQAFGETRPLVPTANGVREPQNRRVELVAR